MDLAVSEQAPSARVQAHTETRIVVWLVTAGLNAFLSHSLLLYHYPLFSYVSAVARLYVDISAGIRSNVSYHIVLEKAPGVPF